jgi:transposase
MATIQSRKSRGHKYWYIVESRRINGKPRPITLAYLGKASDLFARLKGEKQFSVRSYSHGDTRALLHVAEEIGIVQAINELVPAGPTGYRPIRDGLTVGASLLLAALGRACHPTSKRGWYQWAKGTDLDYVLGINSKKLDCQHFWDQMEALPAEQISKIEERIVGKLVDKYGVKLDLLLLDYTNFFTFIDSGNTHCEIPQRGKNKQRRIDLRQIGLALLVSRKEQLPLFHYCYRGNKPDV